jgi:hypothetical protein
MMNGISDDLEMHPPTVRVTKTGGLANLPRSKAEYSNYDGLGLAAQKSHLKQKSQL